MLAGRPHFLHHCFQFLFSRQAHPFSGIRITLKVRPYKSWHGAAIMLDLLACFSCVVMCFCFLVNPMMESIMTLSSFFKSQIQSKWAFFSIMWVCLQHCIQEDQCDETWIRPSLSAEHDHHLLGGKCRSWKCCWWKVLLMKSVVMNICGMYFDSVLLVITSAVEY